MSLERFLQNALSSWMNCEGPESDIVLSSRVRLARNFNDYTFPTVFSHEVATEVIELVKKRNETEVNSEIGKLEMLEMSQLQPLEKQVLVEKHLISPQLIEETRQGACLLIRK